jgi:hypothetical protein
MNATGGSSFKIQSRRPKAERHGGYMITVLLEPSFDIVNFAKLAGLAREWAEELEDVVGSGVSVRLYASKSSGGTLYHRASIKWHTLQMPEVSCREGGWFMLSSYGRIITDEVVWGRLFGPLVRQRLIDEREKLDLIGSRLSEKYPEKL